MTHKKKVEELLDQFVKDKLKKEDLEYLFSLINQEEDNEHVTAWFYHIWNEIYHIKPDTESIESFNKLKAKLNLENLPAQPGIVNLKPYKRNPFLFRNFIKYAAVVTIAFISSWFIYNYLDKYVNASHETRNEIRIPYGSKGNLILADGTQVWLNSGSYLTYSNFSGKTLREVYLEGEAFFDVTKDKNKPFIVSTPSIKIKVLGTKFNVRSYPSDKTTETTLVSGKVEIEDLTSVSGSKRKIFLEPNQKATIEKVKEKKISEDKITESPVSAEEQKKPKVALVNPEYYTAWKDQKLVFINEKFESLIVKLERWYGVEITVKDSLIMNYRYTGTFEKENIEQAIKALKLATPFDYRIDKNKVEIIAVKNMKKK